MLPPMPVIDHWVAAAGIGAQASVTPAKSGIATTAVVASDPSRRGGREDGARGSRWGPRCLDVPEGDGSGVLEWESKRCLEPLVVPAHDRRGRITKYSA